MTSSTNPIISSPTSQSLALAKADGADRLRFGLLCALVVMASAAFCGLAPIALSIATVFLFAGPHNWIELRYFLSRLPARFKNLKLYFATGITGAVAISFTFPALAFFAKSGVISFDAWSQGYRIANLVLIAWVASLVLIRHPVKSVALSEILRLTSGVLFVAAAATAAWFSPGYFGMALVYAHPLVALVMLDIELRRGKPHLVAPYRYSLALIPLMLAILWWQFSAVEPIAVTDPVIAQICRHAGADWFTTVSTRFLVAAHTFLETIHYAIWLVAIPLLSAGWQNWRAKSYPITVAPRTATASKSEPAGGITSLSSTPHITKHFVRGVLAFSTFAMVVLWFCFGINFNVAREWYFMLAMVHVLAEIPFLIRFL